MCSTHQDGYDYELVTDKNQSGYMCMICQLLARDAHQARCCGKIYCEGCLTRLTQFAHHSNCPNCRHSLKDMLFKDTRVNREISSLMVYCVNKAKGCEWQGELRHANDHDEECPKQEVKCEDCNEMLLLDVLEDHCQTECPKRPYACPHCQKVGKFDFISGEHINTCPDFIIGCPNESCDVKTKRSKMRDHRQICPKEVIKCRHAAIGCSMKRKREFYTSPGGYKLELIVFPNGIRKYHGQYMSCAVFVISGEHDSKLERPFRGIIKLELLNQRVDYHHLCREGRCDGSSNVVPFLDFISLSDLKPDHYRTEFMKEDSLYFRVTASVQSAVKSWLV